MSKKIDVGVSSRLASFPMEFSMNHKSPSMESKYVSEEDINITKTEPKESSASLEVSNNNEPATSEARYPADLDHSPNRATLLDDKPLLQQGPLATIGKEEGATFNKFFSKEGRDMAAGLKYRDPGNAPDMGSAQEAKYKLGCAFGVFFPVLQNILGVLLFIRVPQITGKAGVSASILIVALATATTFFTVLSTAAIATNGKIKLGGSYYLISRSLGPPSGGSVGILFYLGTTFAGAMYILGAVEAVLISFVDGSVLGDRLMDMRVFGLMVLCLLVFIGWVGMSFAAKIGIVFLGVVLLSIVSMYIGVFTVQERYVNGKLFLTGFSGSTFKDNWEFRANLEAMFLYLAIYFPSVTGIMAGANRSGDLQNPSRAIPIGSILAQNITTFIYMSFPILFGFIATREGLEHEDWLFTAEISWPHSMVVRIGIILSSLGAGLQSIIGAPRILQAVANDKLIPICNCFSKNVTRPLLLTGGICLLAVMIGDINIVTPIITMFFLLTYGYVNVACLVLQLMGSLNWRPKWKCYSWLTALLGVLLCAALMFMISWYSAILAIIMLILLYVYIDKKSADKDWGDSIEGMKAQRALDAVLKVNRKRRDHVKNWRPHVLAIGSLNLKIIQEELDQEEAKLNGGVFANGQLNNIAEEEAEPQNIEIPIQDRPQERKRKCCAKGPKKQKDRSDDYKFKEKQLMYKPYIDEVGLLDFMHMMKKNTGLAIYGASFPGKLTETRLKMVQKVEERLYKRFTAERRRVITKVYLGETEDSADSFLMQASGIGGLEPNTVLLNWPQNWEDDIESGERFLNLMKLSRFTGKMAIVLKSEKNFEYQYIEMPNGKKKKAKLEGFIDIWSFTYESGTLLLFAFILKKSSYWRRCKVRLFTVTSQHNQDFERTMKQFLKDVRLDQLLESIEEVVIGNDAVMQFTLDLEKVMSERHKLMPEDVRRMDSLAHLNTMDRQRLDQARKGRARKWSDRPSETDIPAVPIEDQKSLNKLILKKSSDSQLVITNMPEIAPEQSSDEYLQFGEILTRKLNRVVLIKNSGKEVITEYT